MCGRDLVNFFHGEPLKVDGIYSDELIKITGNDIPMTSTNCISVNGFNVCWEDVVKPYDFINKKCQLIEGEMFCLEHIVDKYKNPDHKCVRYVEDWVCADRIQQTWVTGGCVIINGKEICGGDFYRLAAQKCLMIEGQQVCPNALGGPNSGKIHDITFNYL